MENKRVAIIISSDSGYRVEREDASGPVIKEIVEDKEEGGFVVSSPGTSTIAFVEITHE